ncbi:hypothetical protein RDABS01_031955 [Bienertia sinuspersici]
MVPSSLEMFGMIAV